MSDLAKALGAGSLTGDQVDAITHAWLDMGAKLELGKEPYNHHKDAEINEAMEQSIEELEQAFPFLLEEAGDETYSEQMQNDLEPIEGDEDDRSRSLPFPLITRVHEDCLELVTNLADMNCAASINDGILTLEDGTQIDLLSTAKKEVEDE